MKQEMMGGSSITWTICKFLSLVGRGKLDQSSPESLRTSCRPVPIIVPNFIAHDISDMMCVTIFLPTCEFWHPWGTIWAKVHQSWNWCTAKPDLSMCQILSHFDTFVHDICCQTSLILLIAWPTNKKVSSYHLAIVSKFHVAVTDDSLLCELF